jgi:hypothetical protein
MVVIQKLSSLKITVTAHQKFKQIFSKNDYFKVSFVVSEEIPKLLLA